MKYLAQKLGEEEACKWDLHQHAAKQRNAKDLAEEPKVLWHE
jgi:hypothetical protein